MHSRLILAAAVLMLPLAVIAAPSAPSKNTRPEPPAYDPVRYKSCTVYAATAMSAAVEMRANGFSARRALLEGGNPPSPPVVALTEFAASAIQARPAGGRDAAATLTGFLTGICYQRSDLPTIQ